MANQITYSANIAPPSAAIEVSYNGGTSWQPLTFATVGSLQQAVLANVPAATYAIGQVGMGAVGYPASRVFNTAALTVLAAAAPAAAPTLTSVSPTSAAVGAAVTLTGTGFTGATAVNFNGLTASFTVISDTSINATVPAGATAGSISVTVGSSTATSSGSFTVSATNEYAIAPTTVAKSALNGPIKYILVGNSFGEGYPVNGRDITKIFFNLVTASLQTTYGASNVTNVNLSVGGRSTAVMLQSQNVAAVMTELNNAPAGAQVILQWLEGENELFWNTSVGGNNTAAQGLADLTSWINTFKGHASRPVILIATATPRQTAPYVSPISAQDQTYEDRRHPYNIGVRQNYAASVEGVVDFTNSVLGDTPAANLNGTYYNTDGVHPIEAGHQIIANQTLAAITPRLNTVVAAAAPTPAPAPAATWHNVTGGGSIDATDATIMNGVATGSFSASANSVKAIGASTASGVVGSVEYAVVETATSKLFGLRKPGMTTSYQDEEIAFYNDGTGLVRVFTLGGNNALQYSGYAVGDLFRIDVTTSQFLCYHNNVLKYTGTRTDTGALSATVNLTGPSGPPSRIKLNQLTAVNPVTSAI